MTQSLKMDQEGFLGARHAYNFLRQRTTSTKMGYGVVT